MTPAVFDCVVFLQAAANPAGAAGACLEFVESGHVRLFLSASIFQETRDVLRRPETRRRFPKLSEKLTDRFLLKINTLGTFVAEVPAMMQLPRDPKDEPYLNLAIATHASFIVSRDKDLLSLMKDEAFCSAYPDLRITDPATFLNHVRADIAKERGAE